MNKNVEILAPCGSFDILKCAINAGADACYIGGSKYGARAYAKNTDEASLISAIEYAHLHDTKLYLTVNTLFKPGEINELYNYMLPYYEAGLDAAIVQDLGAFLFLHREFPELNLHCSTQMNITSVYSAKLMKEAGASRIVTAREMSLQEIRAIKDNCDIEIESFVHGAMCYSYSGQCLMSSLAGGRSGNRGRCAQPCRQKYNDCFCISMKDMCTLGIIPDIIESGVYSLKIEGRMKNEYYTASAVAAYKEITEDYLKGKFDSRKADRLSFKLKNVFNRGGFCNGYYNGMTRDMVTMDKPNNQGVNIGKVRGTENGKVVIDLAEDVYSGDVFEVKLKDNTTIDITISGDYKKGKTVSFNSPKTKFIQIDRSVYRTRCNKLLKEIENDLINKKKTLPVNAVFNAVSGSPISFYIERECEGLIISAYLEENEPELAQSVPSTKEEISKKLLKLGDTDYYYESLDIRLSDNIFVPASKINQMRRDAFKILEENNKKRYLRKTPDYNTNTIELEDAKKTDRSVYVDISINNIKQLETVMQFDNISAVFIEYEMLEHDSLVQIEQMIHSRKTDFILNLPYVIDSNFSLMDIRSENDDGILNSIDGICIRNIDALGYIQEYRHLLKDKKIICAASLYAYNNYSREFIRSILNEVIFELPYELNLNELKDLKGYNNCELLVFGRQRVMLTAQKLPDPVTGKTISDIKKNEFYIKSYGKYNVILNGKPVNIINKLDDIQYKNIHFNRYKLDFTNETEEEVYSLISRLIDRKYSQFDDMTGFTTGHYYRGVE